LVDWLIENQFVNLAKFCAFVSLWQYLLIGADLEIMNHFEPAKPTKPFEPFKNGLILTI
jgi:hypothetical protein